MELDVPVELGLEPKSATLALSKAVFEDVPADVLLDDSEDTCVDVPNVDIPVASVGD